MVTDGEFDDVTATNMTNVISGGWKLNGSTEVWNYRDGDETSANQWAVFPGTSGTISQNISGLLVNKPYFLSYEYMVRASPKGAGACNLTTFLAGTPVDQLSLETTIPTGTYTYWAVETPIFTPTVASGELVFAFDCAEPLVVYLSEVDVMRAGGGLPCN